MTHRSKREIERAVEELDVEASEERTTPSIKEHCSEDVVEFVYGLARDLFQLSWHNADEVVNASDPEATLNYLDIVRTEYGITDDRDDDVSQQLLDASSREKNWDTIDSFAMAPVGVATHLDPETDAGETLAALVDGGREEEAEQLLVGATYDLFARTGGGVKVNA